MNANILSSSSNSSSGFAASNLGRRAASGSEFSLLSGWGAILLAIVVLVVLFAVYYQTIGYYIQLGWDKLSWSRKHGETIEIDAPGGMSAQLTPASTGGNGSGAPLGMGLEKVLGSLESDVAAALGEGSGGGKQFARRRAR
jgi:hypothetical protein